MFIHASLSLFLFFFTALDRQILQLTSSATWTWPMLSHAASVSMTLWHLGFSHQQHKNPSVTNKACDILCYLRYVEHMSKNDRNLCSGVDLGSTAQQQLDDVGLAAARRQVQWRFTAHCRSIGITAALKQVTDDVEMAHEWRYVEWSQTRLTSTSHAPMCNTTKSHLLQHTASKDSTSAPETRQILTSFSFISQTKNTFFYLLVFSTRSIPSPFCNIQAHMKFLLAVWPNLKHTQLAKKKAKELQKLEAGKEWTKYLRHRAQVGAVLQQQLNHLDAILLARNVQRREPVLLSDIRQHLNCIEIEISRYTRKNVKKSGARD